MRIRNTIAIALVLCLAAPALFAQGGSCCRGGQGRRGAANERRGRGPTTIKKVQRQGRAGSCGLRASEQKAPGMRRRRGRAQGCCCDSRQGRRSGLRRGQGRRMGRGRGQQMKAGIDRPVVSTRPPNAAFALRLQTALESELYARDYYKAARKALPQMPHFARLEAAEQRHANAISTAIRQLGAKPLLKQKAAIKVPTTAEEANAECRRIELHVIKLYKGLIADCPDLKPVQTILNNLQRANYRHLRSVGG